MIMRSLLTKLNYKLSGSILIRKFPVRNFRIFAVSIISVFPAKTFANDGDKKTQIKIGKGRKQIQRKSCQVPVNGGNLTEGELAEVLDSSNTRVAIVKMEKLKNRLVATVISGEEQCSNLRGLSVKPLSAGGKAAGESETADEQPMLYLAPRYQVSQNALPGLALNKFLTPGYTQKGFQIAGVGIFPRKPIAAGPLMLNFKVEGQFSSVSSSPLIDLVRDGKVLGSQNIGTTALNLRGGGRINYLSSQAWSGAGIILLDKLASKSTLTASGTPDPANPVFQVIRDISSSGFGIYAEQGFIINNSAIVMLSGNLGFGTKVTTPVVEDGDATNTGETLTVASPPVALDAKLVVPFVKWVFAEVAVDYRKFSVTVPLINNSVSKAQIDVTRVSAGVGIRY